MFENMQSMLNRLPIIYYILLFYILTFIGVYGVPNSLDSLFTIVVVKFSFFASFFLLLISVEKWIS